MQNFICRAALSSKQDLGANTLHQEKLCNCCTVFSLEEEDFVHFHFLREKIIEQLFIIIRNFTYSLVLAEFHIFWWQRTGAY